MVSKIISFLKNPVYQEDENQNFKYRLTILWRLLFYALLLSFIFGILNAGIESLFGLDFGKHAIDTFMEQHSPWFLLLTAVVLAPLLEELLFRGPLLFFKNSRYFGMVFYLFTLLFGFYHITNFETNSLILLLSPLLVAPQLSVGLLLGFIRVRFGLPWAIALHALYNLVLIGPFVVLQLLDITLE